MSITPEKLDEIECGLEGVTPGPWEAEKGGRGSWIKGSTSEWAAMGCGDTDASADANSEHIARMDPATVRELVRLARVGMETDALHRDLLVGGLSIRRIDPVEFHAENKGDD